MAHSTDGMRVIRIGDIYMVEFDGVGSEQKGLRPALIFQNNVGNKRSPNVVVLPMTSVKKKLCQPTHVLVRANRSGLRRDSVILCENPECVSKSRLGSYIATLPEDLMKDVAAASLLATGAIAFMDEMQLRAIYHRAVKLNRNKN